MDLTTHSRQRSNQQDESDLVCICGGTHLIDLGPCRELGRSGSGSEYETDLSSQVDPGHLYRCQDCHLGLRLPRPSDDVIASLYESLPRTRWKEGKVAGTAQQYLVKRLQRFKGQRRSVLDIGAFDGSFLQALPSDFEKAAIEPSDAAAELEKQNIHVLKPFLQPANDAETGQFDIVTMFDVFEHLADPIQGMHDAMSYVRGGGLLFVGTGNMDHWSWRQTRGTHWYLDPIQHLCVGSRKHFRWQAARLGARSQRCRTFSHQPGTLAQRFSQALTTVYFGARGGHGGGRAVVRLMNVLPAFRRLSHKQAMPYTQQLHDHILGEFVRSEVVS